MKHILWLASWYPDEISPYNGDFIQRHALAVSERMPLTVVYVAQHGPDVELPASKVLTVITGNLTELIIYFPYRKTGVRAFDKLQYNWKYFYHYRQFIRKYLKAKGNPSLIHLHVPMKAGRIAWWLKESFGIPYIVSEHSSAYSDEVPDSYSRRSNYYQKWVSRVFKDAIAVTTVSQKLGSKLKELFGVKNMHIVPNVADTHYFNHSPNKPAHFRFLHASTMDHPKNVEGLLRCLQRLKQIRTDWECTMLGWDTPALRNLATDLELDGHIKWKGVVPYAQVAVEMQHASALLMFSRYENLPCVILEALCCGLPVISTSVGGIPEVINENNGILVQPENEEQLLQAMQQCMNSYDEYDRAAISRNAQNQFSYQAVAGRFIDIYEKI